MNIHSLMRHIVLSAAAVCLGTTAAHAEDIDIFAAGNGSSGGVANVLMVIDNAASFSANAPEFNCSISPEGVVDTSGKGKFPTQLDGKAAAVEQCALYAALQKLQADAKAAADAGKPNREFNLAVMGFNDNSIKSFTATAGTAGTFNRDCVGSVGGCLMLPFTRFNSTNAPRILEWIRKWDDDNGGIGDPYIVKTNNNANGAVMQEAWAYLNGRTGISGRNYVNIAPPADCGGKSIIFVGNAYNVNASPGDRTNNAESPRLPFIGSASDGNKNANPASTPKERDIIRDSFRTKCEPNKLEVLKDDEGRGIYALNWAAYMRGQGVVTFAIGILGDKCNAEYAAHLEKMGSLEVGGGGFFPTTNFQELSLAFSTAINQIIAVNTAFASVSLPVSVNTQGAFLNQVFIGQFRPDQSFLPQWYGNLKQYRMAEMSNSLRLVDSVGTAAINTVTGFIDGCARSYWGPVLANDYWPTSYPSNCVTAFSSLSAAAAADASSVSDTPDGGIVEKGGQAYVLRNVTPGNRNAKTCVSASTCVAGTLADFSTSNSAVVGAVPAINTSTSTVSSENLVNWARGLNIDNDLRKGTTVMRPSVHGDVVHSRPVAVNYGSDDAPDIVVFYGANDGFLRAVNGNQTTASVYNSTSYAPGAELWSFMPYEFYKKIPRLYANTQGINLPTGSNDGRAAKDYGMDGAVTAFQGTVTRTSGTTTLSGQKKYLFATMRRGGRAVYAFDVTSPASPTLLWRKGCDSIDNDTNCSTGFTALGQTWSSAKTMYVTGYDSGNNPLVIMGGGYDPRCEDVDTGTTALTYRNRGCTGLAASTQKGNRIFVLDGIDGSVVREFTTDRGVIGDVTIVAGADGKARYAYAADLGGNVYRLTFSGVSTAWSIRKIAELGCDDPSLADCALGNTTRKFMFAPSVVTADGGLTYNILLGSGDREKPVRTFLATQSVQNYFFMLKDKPTDPDWFNSEATLTGCGVTKSLLCLRSLTPITAGVKPTDAALTAKKGWYLGLVSGEQVVTSALTLFGVTTFSTSQPPVTSTTSCTADLGTTLVYNVNYQNAFSATNEALPYAKVTGGGLPPSPVGGLVLIDGKKVPFCIGCRAESPLESKRAGVLSDTLKPVGRSYWYIKQ